MSSPHPLLLGIDVGTQSVRAALHDLAGNCRSFAVSPLTTTYPQPGWAEQEAIEWWQATQNAVRQALAGSGASADQVAGIGLDCTACTVVAARADGTPIRKSLLWMDQRAFREAQEISATRAPCLKYVAGTVSPEWMLPKALWLKRSEPESFRAAERLVECTDWMMFRLTGEWTLSLNNVTVKWNYARPEGGWDRAFLNRIDLADILEKWPGRLVALGRGEGQLSEAAARALGLRKATPVAQGGIDAYLGMLGLGAAGAGDLAMIMGSSTCHLAMSPRGIFDSGMAGCYPDAVVEDLFTLEGGQTATGSIVNWYRQHFGGFETWMAEQTGRGVYEILDEKAAAVPPGCDGLVCLDFWQGSRSPVKDPRARGALWGFTLSHGPGHVYRSIYEGTALGTRHIVEDLETHGVKVARIFAGGGGAKSRLWLQIHADVLGRPLHLPRESEACCLGAAMAAAVRAGLYADFPDAARQMVQVGEVIEPEVKHRPVYDAAYERYRATYPALRGLMHGLADAQAR